MSNYFVNKDNKTGEIIYLEYNKNGYSVSPKTKRKDDIEVNKIVFVSPELTNKLIKKKLDIKLNKLLKEYNVVSDNDDDEGNATRLRDKIKEAERLKLTIINEYSKYLPITYSRLTLKKLQIIIDGYRNKLYQLRSKKEKEFLISMYKQMAKEDYDTNKKGKGR